MEWWNMAINSMKLRGVEINNMWEMQISYDKNYEEYSGRKDVINLN